MPSAAADLLVDLVRQATDHHGHDGHAHDAHGPDHGSHNAANGTAAANTAQTASAAYCSTARCRRNWKIAFAVILFVEGVLFGYVALVLRRMACLATKRFYTLLSFVNIGGGGIFLATGLLHILPEALEFLAPKDPHANEGAHNHEGHNHGAHGFPVGPAVILATFVAFLFIEKVLFPHSHRRRSSSGGVADDEKSPDTEHGGHTHEWTEAPTEENAEPPKRNGVGSSEFMTMLLTTMFIALHSIFESVALGSAQNWGTVLNIFIAIATHRWATTMALGARYERAHLSALGYALLVVGFAAIAPIGVAIGFGVRGASDTAIGVVFALSAGIFLYVGGFETPAEELVENSEYILPKLAVYALGCGIITLITGILVATGRNVH